MKLIFPVLCALIFGQASGQAFQWARSFSGCSIINGFGSDAKGNLYVGGEFLGSMFPGCGALNFGDTILFAHYTGNPFSSSDMFIVKYDPSGKFLWALNSEKAGSADVTAIHVDSDGNILAIVGFADSLQIQDIKFTQATDGDCLLLKFNSDGKLIMHKDLDPKIALRELDVVSEDYQKNIIISGVCFGVGQWDTISTYSPEEDLFFAKLDSNGNFIWVRLGGATIGGGGINKAVCCDKKNNLYFISYTQSNAFGIPNINDKSLLVKYNANGILQWVTYSTDSINEYCNQFSIYSGVGVDKNSNVYVTGGYVGTIKFGNITLPAISNCSSNQLLVKYDSSGNLIWIRYPTKPHGLYGLNDSYGIWVDSTGTSYTLGFFSGTLQVGNSTVYSIGDWDGCIIKTYADGVRQIYKTFGSPGYERVFGILKDYQGSLCIAAYYEQNMLLDYTHLYGKEFSSAAFVAKINDFVLPQFPDSVFCPGDTIRIPIDANTTFDSSNIFSVQLSDSMANFNNALLIGVDRAIGSDTIIAIIPSGLPAGVYYLRVISSNPAEVSAEFMVTIGIPRTIVSSGPTTFCHGISDTLSINGPRLLYQWKKDGMNISGATNFSLTVISGGSYSCLVSDKCGSAISDTVNIKDDLVAVQVIYDGKDYFCQGTNDTLFAFPDSGLNYQWFKSEKLIEGATNNYYKVNSTDVITVEVTDVNGCSAISAPVSIKKILPLSPKIDASGVISLCEGDSINLIIYLFGNITFQWQWNGVDIPGATNNAYLAKTTGNYSCIVTDQCGSYSSDTSFMTIYPPPAVPVITESGDTLFSSPAPFYQWQLDSNNIPGATNQFYIASQSGNYTVVVSVTYNCLSSATIYFIPTAVDQVKDNSLLIFPNPSNGYLHLRWNNNSYGIAEITVVDILGRPDFLIDQATAASRLDQTLDLHMLPAGIYFIELSGKSLFYKSEIIITK